MAKADTEEHHLEWLDPVSVWSSFKSCVSVSRMWFSKLRVVRIQWNLKNSSDHAKYRNTRRKIHWFWLIRPEILFGLRDNSDYVEFTVVVFIGKMSDFNTVYSGLDWWSPKSVCWSAIWSGIL